MSALDAASAKRVMAAVKERLGQSNMDDDVLPEYVIVMLQNGKAQPQVASELEAFMGRDAVDFAAWVRARLPSPPSRLSPVCPSASHLLLARHPASALPLHRRQRVVVLHDAAALLVRPGGEATPRQPLAPRPLARW
jgi:hypothetical protein